MDIGCAVPAKSSGNLLAHAESGRQDPCPRAASRASQPVTQDRAVAAKACRSADALQCSSTRPCASIAD